MKWFILSSVQLTDLKSILRKLENEEIGVIDRKEMMTAAKRILEDISQLTVVSNL